MKVFSKVRNRGDWSADYEVVDGRVSGTLWSRQRRVRDFKKVKLYDDGSFHVDIGTCSGVKVKFVVA